MRQIDISLKNTPVEIIEKVWKFISLLLLHLIIQFLSRNSIKVNHVFPIRLTIFQASIITVERFETKKKTFQTIGSFNCLKRYCLENPWKRKWTLYRGVGKWKWIPVKQRQPSVGRFPRRSLAAKAWFDANNELGNLRLTGHSRELVFRK